MSRSGRAGGRSVAAMDVFGQLRAMDVRSLAGPVVVVQVPRGTTLVREGEPIGTFFVIRSGSAEVWCADHKLDTLGEGDCFGEIVPVDPGPQRHSVIASSPMRLLIFSAFGIDQLCAAIPYARERILSLLPNGSSRPLALR